MEREERIAHLIETFLDERDSEHAVLDADPHAEKNEEGRSRVSSRHESERRSEP